MARLQRVELRVTTTLMSTCIKRDDKLFCHLRDRFHPALAEDVLKYAWEQSWPVGIRTLGARNTNRESLSRYSAFLITTFENMSVLALPPSHNEHMQGDLKLTRLIYWIAETERTYVLTREFAQIPIPTQQQGGRGNSSANNEESEMGSWRDNKDT
eukprot:TRINITY_DN1584_c0_g3_i1.p1 TRINITY_DN1584_c0_g3~~TRINITY_DN1584_c0_g3_i1.p1  ORF type:complete len:173 (+),score=55.97 TRINITY_DN1584_c0_g3_i1:52-519(+)